MLEPVKKPPSLSPENILSSLISFSKLTGKVAEVILPSLSNVLIWLLMPLKSQPKLRLFLLTSLLVLRHLHKNGCGFAKYLI